MCVAEHFPTYGTRLNHHSAKAMLGDYRNGGPTQNGLDNNHFIFSVSSGNKTQKVINVHSNLQ